VGVAVAERDGQVPALAHPPEEATSDARGAPADRAVYRVPDRIRWILGIASALVVALVISLIVRSIGSSYTPVDGWGVDAFELSMGALCVARYFERSWRSGSSTARVFPLVMGLACIAWGLGDLVLTVESLGGATPSVPSAADVFYVGFFPLCFLAFALLIRRGNRSSLAATSLDGMIAGRASPRSRPPSSLAR
jgi:hypothetical protein